MKALFGSKKKTSVQSNINVNSQQNAWGTSMNSQQSNCNNFGSIQYQPFSYQPFNPPNSNFEQKAQNKMIS